MLELADKTDLESVGKPCRFEPCYPHQEKREKQQKQCVFLKKNPFFKNTPQTHPKIKSLLFFSKAVQMGCLFPAMRIYAIGRTGVNTQVFLCPSRQLGYMTAPPAGSSVRD